MYVCVRDIDFVANSTMFLLDLELFLHRGIFFSILLLFQ